jgi:hypothetical protein
MDPQFKELVDEIKESLDIKKELLESEQRVEGRLKIHFENMEDLLKATADGYGMNLDRIERKVDELNTKFDTKLADHDRVFANHNDRITTLEKQSLS